MAHCEGLHNIYKPRDVYTKSSKVCKVENYKTRKI